MPALAWYALQLVIIRTQGSDSPLARAIGRDLKGKVSPALIGAALALVAAVILVNRLGSYLYPVQREIAPDLVPVPATP